MTHLIGVVIALAAFGLGTAPLQAQEAASVQRGKEVYDGQRCSLCHAVAGRGNAKGPLDTVGSRLSADEIRNWIVSPQDMPSPTNRTPAMRAYPSLPPDDLAALVAYLQSLTGGVRAR